MNPTLKLLLDGVVVGIGFGIGSMIFESARRALQPKSSPPATRPLPD